MRGGVAAPVGLTARGPAELRAGCWALGAGPYLFVTPGPWQHLPAGAVRRRADERGGLACCWQVNGKLQERLQERSKGQLRELRHGCGGLLGTCS